MQVTFGLATRISEGTGIPIWSDTMRKLIEELEDVRNGTEDRVSALAYAHCSQILGREYPNVGTLDWILNLDVLDSCFGKAQRFVLAHLDEFETSYEELAELYEWED